MSALVAARGDKLAGAKFDVHSCVVVAAPTITYEEQLKSPQTLRGGQKLVIDAAIGGVPTPTTGWTVNGQPLTPSDQLKVDVTPTSSKLTITDASSGHSGTYVLKAENVVGTATAEFTVAVKGIFTFT